MSFDLYVYVGELTKDKILNWQKCLEQSGIVCTIPIDLDFSDKTSVFPVKCKLYSSLADKDACVYNSEFLIEPMPVEKEVVDELVDGLKDSTLIDMLQSAKYEIVINTYEEDFDTAMKIKCFVSAALANAFDGVLLDPQESGAVYGARAYEVARYYCSFTKSKPVESLNQNSPKANVFKGIVRKLFPWVVFFLIITFINDMMNLFLK